MELIEFLMCDQVIRDLLCFGWLDLHMYLLIHD